MPKQLCTKGKSRSHFRKFPLDCDFRPHTLQPSVDLTLVALLYARKIAKRKSRVRKERGRQGCFDPDIFNVLCRRLIFSWWEIRHVQGPLVQDQQLTRDLLLYSICCTRNPNKVTHSSVVVLNTLIPHTIEFVEVKTARVRKKIADHLCIFNTSER